MVKNLKNFIVQHYKLMFVVLSVFLFSTLAVGALYVHNRVELVDANARIEELKEEKKEVVRNLAAVEVKSEILRTSQVELRQMIEQLQEEVAEQEKALDFYRQLMTSDDKRQGLEINSYLLKPLEQPGSYHFRLTFVQYAKKHLALKAALTITVEGESNSEKVSYNFRELVINNDEQFDKLQFKYFQVVEGQLQLPEGFIPHQLIIDAQIKTKKPKAWQRKLDWTVEES